MKKLLLQLDSSRLASVFDQVVAYDAGVDQIMPAAGVAPDDVRDLVYGCLFTRGPSDLRNTAIFIGGADMTAGEALLDAARGACFGPFRVSLMLDSNGSNTTAVAVVVRIASALGGDLRGQRVVVTAGTGPVGMRAAGLLARAGAEVTITSRQVTDGERVSRRIATRFGSTVQVCVLAAPQQAGECIAGAQVLLNAGPPGVQLVPRSAWANRAGLRLAVDLNAVPPQGIEGIESADNGTVRDGVICIGAVGVGKLKMKIHKACIAKLFERNDAVLDAESILGVAEELGA
jgi:methylenetetrahydrofolate/methylenetetrahydromethanopterin dehydrogenase (NADP+)